VGVPWVPDRRPLLGGAVETVLALAILATSLVLGSAARASGDRAGGWGRAGADRAGAGLTRVEDTLQGLPGVEQASVRVGLGQDLRQVIDVDFTVSTAEAVRPVVEVATQLLWLHGPAAVTAVRFEGRARTDVTAAADDRVDLGDPVTADVLGARYGPRLAAAVATAAR
jgi:hypothetical protein